jgi:hypothetical protein
VGGTLWLKDPNARMSLERLRGEARIVCVTTDGRGVMAMLREAGGPIPLGGGAQPAARPARAASSIPAGSQTTRGPAVQISSIRKVLFGQSGARTTR